MDSRKWLVAAACAFVTIPAVWDMYATALLKESSRGLLFSDIAYIPHRRVGLVLGCSKELPGGYSNPFFRARIAAAVQLFQAGKVDHLLVSGDNHSASYDEPTAMKISLIEAGIPPNKIVCDYAGLRTLDSVIRARKVFGQSQITIISQGFHDRRAIFIARHNGMDAIGFEAADVPSRDGFRTRWREQLAKMNALVDVYLLNRQPKFLGPPMVVGL